VSSVSKAAPQSPTAAGPRAAPVGGRYFRRFTRAERIMHVLLMLSFVGCALTGLPLLYSAKPWAGVLARLLGGFQAAGAVHRVCAFVMLGTFACHLVVLVRRAVANKDFMGLFWGSDSMVPQPQDAVDLYRNFKWFLGLGPRPQFDRWTYWEKFDYWAVFWGMAIIGGSGLLLWFPVSFAHLLPGWMFNLATLVHGEEALLAVGFIFTIHFFNSHLRPEKFPMDTVIFTGRISEHELRHERAVEYERLVREGRLAAEEAPPPTLESRAFGWFVGGVALLLGIVAIVLIVYSIFQ
jgi:cytochrome b subunit of formate dehydrogenase